MSKYVAPFMRKISTKVEDVTLVESDFPSFGSFPIDYPTLRIIELIQRLNEDKNFYLDFLRKQKLGSMKYLQITNPADQIAQFMVQLENK